LIKSPKIAIKSLPPIGSILAPPEISPSITIILFADEVFKKSLLSKFSLTTTFWADVSVLLPIFLTSTYKPLFTKISVISYVVEPTFTINSSDVEEDSSLVTFILAFGSSANAFIFTSVV